MTRNRINPFRQGEPEHTLFANYRREKMKAEKLEREAELIFTDAAAARAKAEKYAEALRALGQGDKVTPLKALPNCSGERT
jgi:hypothetical protein